MQATAPGKIILFGEHAVVYGRPAIAAPVSQVRATAVITPSPDEHIHLIAPDLNLATTLDEADEENPLAAAVRQVVMAIHNSSFLVHHFTLTVTSQIPIASGMGSGAAITAAVIRALAQHWGLAASNEWVSDLTYEVEKLHHGTPSGIDNTVVAYEQPIYFVRQQPKNKIEVFGVKRPLHLLIADTGIRSSTKVAVGDVRRQWQADPTRFEALFDGCGRIAEQARRAIECGDLAEIGRLMTQNHALLQAMTVSSPELDRLVVAAKGAGALGAKMSGAGRGGNMIALVGEGQETAVRQALLAGGATAVLSSVVETQ
ncbi:MAG: mevalonate kinase [Ardenticatenaceae bacterium]|nr:mevalonate kinase [Ardenticatenaceae bacterium]